MFNYVIFIFYFLKLFINSAIFDLKDKERDNIKTIPILLNKWFAIFLSTLNITAHLLAFLKFGLHVILITSFVASQIAILTKTNKISRNIIDLEPTLSILLYLLLKNVVSRN